MENALVLAAEEGRASLRKSAWSGQDTNRSAGIRMGKPSEVQTSESTNESIVCEKESL